MGWVIDWGAWATFAAGVMAVGAAIFVGTKQTAIQTRQADIQAALAEIEMMKLRSDLFDRRFKIYQNVKGWLGFYRLKAKIPRVAGDDEPPPDSERKLAFDFHKAVDESRFLFRPQVYTALLAISTAGRNFSLQKRQWDRCLEMNRRPTNVPRQHLWHRFGVEI